MFPVKDISIGSTKYVGISRAIVVDNNDPLKRGRIRVYSTVLGETAWIPYLTTPGTFNVPPVDSVVYIQCDTGSYSHPVAWGNFNYGTDDALKFPEEFQRVPPNNRGLYTPAGHLIEIDDGTDQLGTSKGIRVTTADKIKINIADEPSDSSVDILMPSGTHFKIDGTGDQITLETNFGDNISLSATGGIVLTTPAAGGATVELNQGVITLEGSGGAKLKLGTGQVGLGSSSAELLDLIDQIIDEVDATQTGIQAITVPTAVGPSGPPVNSASFIGIQTNLATIKGLLAGIKGGI